MSKKPSPPFRLAIRVPDQKSPRYFGASENGLYRFSMVDFRSQHPFTMQLAELIKKPQDPEYYRREASPRQHSQEEYLKLVEKAVQSIQETELEKVVLSRVAFFEQEVEPLKLFEHLCQRYPQATVFLVTHPQSGTWIGATPEALLRFHRPTISTMSLAGTIRGDEKREFSSKEENEQQFVTDYIFDVLSDYPGVNQIKIGPRRKWQAGALTHLCTELQAQLKPEAQVEDLRDLLHPTPAVAGMPREAALRFIEANEGYDRSYYTGYWGLAQKNSGHYWVNLRCMQLTTQGVLVYAGGGITADSEPQREWEETEAKMHTMTDELGG